MTRCELWGDGPRLQVYWVVVPNCVGADALEPWLSVLDEDEQETYSCLRADHRKVEFLTGRLLLKTVLGRALRIRRGGVRLVRSPYGKPILHGAVEARLSFSPSHSKRVVACVVSSGPRVGIDVEDMSGDHLGVMEKVFVPEEIFFVRSQPAESEQHRAFYLLWTRKEAVMKAVGMGFALPPRSFRVPLEWGEAEDDEYVYHSLELRPGVMCSLVASRSERSERAAPDLTYIPFQDLLEGALPGQVAH